MNRLARTSSFAALLFGLGAVTGAHDGAVGESPPEQITTDTLAYCRELAARLEQLTNAAAEIPAAVTTLSVVGKQMCEQGLTRAGIMRLRTAIVLMLHHNGTAPTHATPVQQ